MSWVGVAGRGTNDKANNNNKKDFCGNAGERRCDYEVRQKKPVQGMKKVESADWVTA